MDLRNMLKGKKLSPAPVQQKPGQLIELGTIDYHNLTADGKHGDFEAALQAAAKTGKPIFANFVEWSGCQGCKDAGEAIFANPVIKEVAEKYFVPVAFNTWGISIAVSHQSLYSKLR